MARFDIPCMTVYWSAIITIALYFTICELFDVEILVRGHLRALKLVPFNRFGAVSYSSSVVTVALYVAVYEIFSVKKWCDQGEGSFKVIGNNTI